MSGPKPSEIYYTDPGQLFLHGLIDTKLGSCGNMAAIHVAVARRMGWPVSLACVKSHFISRFDNGEIVHNIEVTQTDKPGTFSSDTDEWYMKKFELPKKAIESGSDLRCLTAREMIGAFVSLRGRHYWDVHDVVRADKSYALARVLFHNHRRAYIGAMLPMLRQGEELFNPGELGNPDTLFECFAPMFVKDQYHKAVVSIGTEQRYFPFAPRPFPTINSVVGIRNFGRKQIEGAGT